MIANAQGTLDNRGNRSCRQHRFQPHERSRASHCFSAVPHWPSRGRPRPKRRPTRRPADLPVRRNGRSVALRRVCLLQGRSQRGEPLVVALHGLGGDQNSLVRQVHRTVDFAEDGGYILVAPMGYNSGGWYGIPPRPDAGDGRGRVARAREREARRLPMLPGCASSATGRHERAGDDAGGVQRRSRPNLPDGALDGRRRRPLPRRQHASIWAALAPIAPAAFRLDPESLASIPDMPIIIVQGDEDTAVPVENTRRWAAKLEELTCRTSTWRSRAATTATSSG